MAKQMNGVKITVEDRQARYTFDAPEAYLSSTDGGVTTHLSVSPLKNKHLTFLPEKEEAPVPPEDSKTEEPTLNNDQKMGLANILIRAKQIERQQFMNARAVQAAVLEAQKLTAEAQHKFNLSVLEALHTGLSQEDVELHLFTAGFTQLESRVESVHLLDTGLLYEAAE